MYQKYRNTPAQLFKLRMQIKAEVNDLRRTYEEIVCEKPHQQKKHFPTQSQQKTTLIPQSNEKIVQKRHFSPFLVVGATNNRNKQLSPNKNNKSINPKNYPNYQYKSTDNLKKILNQKCQKKKAHSFLGRSTRSQTNLQRSSIRQPVYDGLKVGLDDKSLSKNYRPSKKIVDYYHTYNNIIG